MENEFIKKGLIPLDKSWIIRMGVLDLLNGYNDTITFLEQQKLISDDLNALLKASYDWNSDKEVYVGESGTLYRFLQFASWNYGLQKHFIKNGTLLRRNICDNPEIIGWPLENILALDNGTSQWASAAVLCGNKDKVENMPYKLALSYEAIVHWNKQRDNGNCWIPRYDDTILTQAEAFINILNKQEANFNPIHSEDYCFARAFNFISRKEGEKRLKSLEGHETNRLEEMERCLNLFENEKEIDSLDHRVIQAIAMLGLANERLVVFKYPDSVKKSWPQFWDFLYTRLSCS